MQLIKAVQQALPSKALLFVIDCTTIEYYLDTKSQFINARAKSGVSIISSVQEF